ncbi:MAG: bifunctional oligoribonuclease/PAP phosphatase NrnA [Oscillospiraceae bacterium]|jgi:phosphoesterase RecJ-like protein|nr:bifunctional oligoribonuclease/PAP phosphatase NrnA [Oscillospiraceae bacterium]
MTNQQILDICEILSCKDNFIIIPHSNPDGDAIGSSLAIFNLLKKMSKKCRILCNDPFPKNFEFLSKNSVKKLDDDIFELASSYDSNLHISKNEFILSVDVADRDLLGKSLKKLVNIDMSIDHHHSCKIFSTYSFVDESASATTEIIYEVVKSLKLLDLEIAKCIYTGILTDTGGFRHPNVTPKTHEIVAQLLKIGVNNSFISKNIFDSKTKEQMKLNYFVLGSLEFFFDQKCAMIVITKKMMLESNTNKEDAHCFSCIPRQIKSVLVGISIREEDENFYKISLRTENPINAANLCEKFGGGGHINAAGCAISGTLEDVKKKVLNEVKKNLY